MVTSTAPLLSFLLLWGLTLPGQQPETRGAPAVEAFSPQGTVKNVRQVQARFSDQMVAFGDQFGPAEPFDIDCTHPGSGRWIDGVTWVYDFAAELPAGARCRFDVKTGSRTLDGVELEGRRSFYFDTGGPAIVRSDPWEGSRWVNEDQVFILELDGEVDQASVEANAYFVVEGISSEVGVRVVEGSLREEILETRYFYGDTPPEHRLLLQALQRFPSGVNLQFVWGGGVRSKSGLRTFGEQSLAFRTREAFTASFTCQRENARKDCIPLTGMRLTLSATVDAGLVEGARLVGPGGRIWEPDPVEDESVNSLFFRGPFPPAEVFRLELPAGIVDDAGRELENQHQFPLEVRTDDYPPLAKFSASFGILEAEAAPVLPLTVRSLETDLELGVVEVEGPPVVSGRIRKFEPHESQQILNWLRKLIQRSDSDREQSVFGVSMTQAREFSLPRPEGGKAFEVLGIPLQEKGFYIVELKSQLLGESLLDKPAPVYVSTAALVTDMSVHLKWGISSSLVWVTSLSDAQPVPGAQVEVRDCEGGLLWEGMTDDRGIAVPERLPIPDNALRCSWSWLDGGLFVTARKGSDLSFVHSDWNEGIEPWRFSVPQEWNSELTTAHTILDRPLFRVGETVHLKHIVRERTDRGLRFLPDGTYPNTTVITHLGTGTEYSVQTDWQKGSAVIDWTIPAGAELGFYSVQLESPEGLRSGSGSFRVEDFRVPLMKGVLYPPKEKLVAATETELGISVEYLAGGKAKRLPVRVRYQVTPSISQTFPDFEGFVFSNGAVEEGVERRGSSGEESQPPLQSHRLELDEQGWGTFRVEDIPRSEQVSGLRTELEYRDPNGEIQTVSSQFPVWPARFLAGIKPDGWNQRQKQVSFDVAVVGTDGKPASGREVLVTLFEKKTYSHRKRLVGGFYAFENFTETGLHGSICGGRVDESGVLQCRVESPISGNVVLVARTTDEEGNVSSAHREMWIVGEEDWWFEAEDHDRIDLIPERKRYEPGETARLQVRMPFREATALVTIEREGITDSFITKLSGREPVLEVPVKPEYAPNAFISVLVVRGRVGDVQPTAIVDLGKPAYKLGLGEIQVDWKAHELRVSVESSQEVYRVGDEAAVEVAVTAADGGALPKDAEIALAVVDEGLLELLPNPTWDLLDAMMGRRRHGVKTSTAQMHVVGKRHFGLKALPDGGGGGKQSTRELFDTLLLWKGRVNLDSSGRARIPILLNDSITSFRAVAVATAEADRFGTGSTSFRTTKDLVLFSGIAPLVREGDRIRSEFTVRNATDQGMDVQLEVRITPELQGLDSRTLQLEAGDSEVVGWEIAVPSGIGLLEYEIDASSSRGASDRLRVRQEVRPVVPVRTVAASLASLEQPFSVTVAPPEGALADRGDVRVTLKGSLTEGLDSVRSYMADYPYSCLEQLISKAVAEGDEAAWHRWMEVLPAYLDPNGFLKYFATSSDGSEVLTAYVLALADQASWSIPEASRERMLAALTAFVDGSITQSGAIAAPDLTLRKLAAVEALSRYGRSDPALLTTIPVRPELWPTSAVLDWVGILRRTTGLANRQAMQRQAEQILRSRLVYQGSLATLSTEEGDRLWWLMISGDGNLARLLLTALELEGWREEIPRLVRGFFARQVKGHWDLTTANAWGALAVKRFSEVFEAVPVEGSTQLILDGQERTEGWAEGGPGGEPGGRVAFDWPKTPQPLRIEHRGAGNPWALYEGRAAVPLTEPVQSGFSVRKQITFVEQQNEGRFTVGDVLRVRLEIEAQNQMTWVVVSDPVPAGSLILGSGLGRDSELVTEGEQAEGWVWPTFEERSFEAFRAYYRFVPAGAWVIEYTVRLNSEGSFQTPPTRVEAMYFPEMFAEAPNQDIEVSQ
ncbi:MAG: alpha-2-macroglobulin [Acidobacteriota bacterium]|nr:MAG: alpha-2-macroglobulin [Acidobacteriota bacterium]